MEHTAHFWRTAQENDLDALDALRVACQDSDGQEAAPTPQYHTMAGASDTTVVCAVESDAQIIAAGWVALNGGQAWMGGQVHPSHRRRGIGSALLQILEARACQLGAPTVYKIRNEALSEGSTRLYERAGYGCDLVEIWMRRNLLEALPSISEIATYASWNSQNAAQFFDVYCDAFSTRPGFLAANVNAVQWINDNVEDEDTRFDLCLLALVENEPVGFVTAGVAQHNPQHVGWINQVGVRPAWRGRGISAGMLTRLMTAFKQEGLPALDLHVNVNNPGAIRVYEQLGFKGIGRRGKYSKKVLTT